MIPKSIKWRLQLWYGLILVAVLAGFGVTAYQLERGRLIGRVDDQLHRRIGALGNTLRRPPPRGQNGGGQPLDRPPPGQFADERPPDVNPRPPARFHLPAQQAHFFDGSDANNFYFIILGRDGNEIARSTNAPPFPRVIVHAVQAATGSVNSIAPQIPDLTQPQKVMDYRDFRITTDALPSGETIEVGCTIAPERAELRRAALNLAGVGGLILLVGLAGGWWLVSRAIKPINAISTAAMQIAAGDLSHRINTAETESELGQLAAVLNSTFARLESAFALQKQFADDAAHELRTPVSVILTQTQASLNRERSAPEYRETVEACQRAAQRMRKLIESLLALARFDAGQEVLQRLPFDFAKTVSECAELVRPLGAESSVKLFLDTPSLQITGDSGRLSQVVTNLLTNAIQYNRPGGEVRVTLASQDGLAVLTVADTGQGIAPADLPLVFGRFFRADSSRTGAGNAGLGLAISKAIVEAHGGTIEISSQENVGTTFTVRLPV